MRNYITYFLTGLFLLFVVESKMNVRTLDNSLVGPVSHCMLKKANKLNQTCEKLSIQQKILSENYSLELLENSFQLSHVQAVAVLAAVFTFACFLGLLRFKELKPSLHGLGICSNIIKRFILIRSIRI
ncbi:multisubunit Na+/H+ antiporter MnhG subunit [Chryseobacterium sp. SORGH_AS909]|uniref:Multisubunit Na+/H+ antiporter MnhG subunit n=1 Tax=Chryseobacterium camelliae TaxID=1265445 RepID=A0ABU0TDB1_9FLAO|nr:multisubunit Na+/H+ antiporter MnhG subunit [Chryseobacterium camelliae]MDQ1099005.1 multisubunit Na+/H+ antiporter MnhG subunit [Chryseobacterium sp. SORGH_AS_1048]MDR6086353.1 multisubunit Na+/H+ antiporter MnhG subunit [Chryseobacterium sp. SORGH_AS_0909]MDR6130725.1 multisubunit Na+/H+ antiporter MnhG subunit [Chryseobacterium sp. SORGH_AS_1175]MDT3407143.1 multisubunit Na+/H+ antiporter MnhG subunit [Pseudacidovorax intermedius]